jgi:hypothetical protein
MLQENSLSEWQNGNILWLKEMNWLAEHLPPSQDVLLTNSLSLMSPTKGNAVMTFSVNTRGTTVVPQFEQKLRDDTHRITAPNIKPATNGGAYTHSIDKVTVSLIPPQLQPRTATSKTQSNTKVSPQTFSSEKRTSEETRQQTPPTENPDGKKEQPQEKSNGDGNNANPQSEKGGAV